MQQKENTLYIKTLILGGGLTGLSTAYHLEQCGQTDYLVVEKNPFFGGLCASQIRQGFTFDYAGHLLHLHTPYATALVRRLMRGSVHEVDVMQVGDRYALNVCNFGFDALVCKTMERVRRWPLLGGGNAYTTGILRHIVTGRSTPVDIHVDGKAFYQGRILLCTLANGHYVGGKYKCAPFSNNTDGLLEINLFHPMSIVKFASLIGCYADGSYPTVEEVKPYHHYCRGTEVDISSPRPLYLCVDGEVLCNTRFHVRNLHRVVHFAVPS